MKDCISIIVPIYNVEKYLRQCLDSIINQTYKNIEIILVDDGSPDNCGKICDEYAKNDNRIEVIHKENGGLSSARNAGLDIATGEYIAFIDSDDYVAEDFIGTLYKLCVENNVDISECDFLKFENDVVMQPRQEEIHSYTPNELQHKMYSNDNVKTIVVWNKLYKRYLYEELRFPLGKINEDEFITYKVLYNCKSNIAVTNEQLYYYRCNPQSIMGRKFNEKRLDVIQAFEERKQFYKEKNEMELYYETVVYYQKLLKNLYFQAKRNMENPQKVLVELKNRILLNYKAYKKVDNMKFYSLVLMSFFSHSPTLYYILIEIKNKLARKKNVFKELNEKQSYIRSYKKYKRFCKKQGQTEFLIFNTPIHQNLGDHAIIYAEYELLEKMGIKPFEVSTYKEKFLFDYIKKNIASDAVVSITGGGFIGSQWLEEENLVNKVIKEFFEHKIIIFPQTIYFKDDELGKKELDKSIAIFNKAKNLNIFAREKVTYDFAIENYKNSKVFLAPDIVLSLDFSKFHYDRKGILMCLRNDVEKSISKEIEHEIYRCVKNKKMDVNITDTCLPNYINLNERKNELEKKLQEFAQSQLVITDRLHGMIFAAITGTPCIALSNYNQKVKGVYEWIKHLDYIVYKESVEDLENDVNDMLFKSAEYKIDTRKFQVLLDAVKEN